jgi:hypothetical protein
MGGTVELMQHVSSFQHAVAKSPHDPGWRSQVDERLNRLRRAFAEHVGVTEGPGGLYHELLDHAPRLARGVDDLVRDHAALQASIDHLRRRVASADPEMDQLQAWADELLRELLAHRQRGADLVYEAYGTDIGGETG